MDRTIRLRIKKEINYGTEIKILKLKGTLISKGYTEIIHIADENSEYYLNSFSTSPENKKEVDSFVLDYITNHDLSDSIVLLQEKN